MHLCLDRGYCYSKMLAGHLLHAKCYISVIPIVDLVFYFVELNMSSHVLCLQQHIL